MTRAVEVVLFDLDGTLIDSAPDLGGAANDLRAARGLAPLPIETFRPLAGTGARGMLRAALDLGPADPGYEALRQEFLQRYAQRMLESTVVFAEMLPVLATLEQAGLPWGVVTNKLLFLAEPILAGLGLAARLAVLIGGDSTPFSKPHPEPLREAARRLQRDPQRCVYVGDDLRDVQAGREAGMATLAAAWGYLGAGEPVHAWGADAVIDRPAGLLHWLALP
jgi:phosphoglycolate phosphatase